MASQPANPLSGPEADIDPDQGGGKSGATAWEIVCGRTPRSQHIWVLSEAHPPTLSLVLALASRR